jgi:hypothetical protein
MPISPQTPFLSRLRFGPNMAARTRKGNYSVGREPGFV